MSDVQLLLPPGSVVSLPTSLQWKARRSGETYRVFVYAKGDLSKTVLDSGSLGMGLEFPLSPGSLPEGSYEAVVQVRDAVVGYGQSQAHFVFTIGKATVAGQGDGQGLGVGGGSQQAPAAPTEPAATAVAAAPPPTDIPPTAEPGPSGSQAQPTSGSPALQLDLYLPIIPRSNRAGAWSIRLRSPTMVAAWHRAW